jgi:hypothetical protein
MLRSDRRDLARASRPSRSGALVSRHQDGRLGPLSERGVSANSSGDTFPLRAEPQLGQKALSEFVRTHGRRFYFGRFFTERKSPPPRADNLPTYILPNWPRDTK